MRHRLLLSLTPVLLTLTPAHAQPPAGRPGGLDLVPTTAFAFVTVRASDLRENEALKPVREAIARYEKGVQSLEGKVGIRMDEVGRVTLFWPAAPGMDADGVPVVILTTRAPFNEAKVLRALQAVPYEAAGRHGRHPGAGAAVPTPAAVAPKPPTEFKPAGPPPGVPVPPKFQGPGEDGAQVKDDPPKARKELDPDEPVNRDPAPAEPAELYALGERGAFAVLYRVDDRTLVFFPSVEADRGAGLLHLVGQLLRRRADGPLADALAAADRHTLAAAARVGSMEAVLFGHRDLPRELVPFRSLLRARTAALTADLGAKATVTARLTFADDAAARRAEPVLKTLLQSAVDGLGEVRKQAGKDPEWANVMHPLIDLAAGALDKADVKTEGAAVTARVEAEIGPAVARAVAGLPDLTEMALGQSKTSNNLKQIGLAVHNFESTYQHLPGNITDPAGRPLLSWRVALLPYLEQDNLFRQLDLTKAWNDPRNARLLEKVPEVYRVHGRAGHEKGLTYFQMPTSLRLVQPARPGPAAGDPFHMPGRRLTFAGVPDGLSNTIMVVEAAEGVAWAKPDDLVFDPQANMLPRVGAPDARRFHAAFGDGAVRVLRKDRLTEQQLKAMMTVNGGEVFAVPD